MDRRGLGQDRSSKDVTIHYCRRSTVNDVALRRLALLPSAASVADRNQLPL